MKLRYKIPHRVTMTRRDRYGEPVPADPVPPATDPLVACSTCGTSMKRCEFDRSQMRGRCCPDCPHIPPVTKTRRKRIRKATNEQETSA